MNEILGNDTIRGLLRDILDREKETAERLKANEIRVEHMEHRLDKVDSMHDLMIEMDKKLERLAFGFNANDAASESKALQHHEQSIRQILDWLCGTGPHDPGVKNRIAQLEQERAKELGKNMAYGTVGVLLGGIISFVATNHTWLIGK